MYKLLFVIPFMMTIHSFELHAQTESPKDFISFDMDYATFRATEGLVHLEIYLLVSRTEFKFFEDGERYKSEHQIDVRVLRNDSLVAHDSWERIDRADDLDSVLPTQLLPDYSDFILPPGTYNLLVTFSDKNAGISGKRQVELVLTEFKKGELIISDLQLATEIKKVEKNGIFTKYGRDVIPNASSTYGIEIPVLYIYCEIYNFAVEEGEELSNYQVEYSVTDLNGKELLTPGPKVHKKPGESTIEMGGINVVSLKSRGYYFRIKVTDIATGAVATRSKKYFVYRPGDIQELADADQTLNFGVDGYIESIYSEMTLKELDDEWAMMRILAVKHEKKLYDGSDEPGRRRVMLKYWQAREDRITRNEFMLRATIAKQQWSGLRPGWKTDRGRVMITYGRPDEIEREPHSINSRPFEVWRYFGIDGGIEFVFVDKQGFTDYELVHSTARNELQDYNWTRWIQVSSSQQGATIGR